MRRDKVIGLGLAIILIGFAAAFCYRNEQADPYQGPKLKNPQALDKAVADKLGPKPYGEKSRPSPSGVELQGVEVGSPDDLAADRHNDRRPMQPASPFEARPGQSRRQAGDYARSAAPPAPIPTPGESSAAPEHNRDWVPVPPNPEAQSSHRPQEPFEEWRMHRVRKGDTLSELAAEYLGSSVRFMEIYHANRHVLKSPDDLPVGMNIRIPARRTLRRASRPIHDGTARPMSPPAGRQSRAPQEGSDDTRSAEHSGPIDLLGDNGAETSSARFAVEQRSNGSERRFVPVRRSPFRADPLRLSMNSGAGSPVSKPNPDNLTRRFDYQFFPKGD